MDLTIPKPLKEVETVSVNQERKKHVVMLKVKRFAASSRAEEADNQTVERSRGGHHEADRGANSSICGGALKKFHQGLWCGC